MRLNQSFYNQPTLKVARELLGNFLIHKVGNKKIIGQITETESYIGPNDLASHASKGKTKRTEIMFGDPGYWYVYLIYGMYYCLNIVTEHKNYPAAVLIRSVKPISGLPDKIKTDGPGKLSREFKIDKKTNGQPGFGHKTKLWIEINKSKPAKLNIKKAPRIGIEYAGKYKGKLWRFYIDD